MNLRSVITVSLTVLSSFSCAQERKGFTVIDESKNMSVIADKVAIDKVWSGHRVGFSLLTSGDYQFVAYYNADRRMMAGMRKLDEKNWTLFQLPSEMDQPPRYKAEETSTILGWDSHNNIVMAVDANGFIHLSGNMHCNGLTYFRSQKPNDITTLKQIKNMTGQCEDRCTYPVFMKSADGRLLYHYRHGDSSSGIEYYNLYDVNSQTWARFLDTPLTSGKEKDMNAYMRGPIKGKDGWYHASWVWRDTPDAATNHDLSYMKSPNLVNWYDVAGRKLQLPVTIDVPGLIIDPVPVNGGIINGSGIVGFDNEGKVVVTYHKFDKKGYTQIYCARYENENWKFYQLTDWDYRWQIGGGGSLQKEISHGAVTPREDGFLELTYSHIKDGSGCWLLDSNDLSICGKVIKPKLPHELRQVTSQFPGMQVMTCEDSGSSGQKDIKYVLKWETLGPNRDQPRTGELPEPSRLFVYKLKQG